MVLRSLFNSKRIEKKMEKWLGSTLIRREERDKKVLDNSIEFLV